MFEGSSAREERRELAGRHLTHHVRPLVEGLKLQYSNTLKIHTLTLPQQVNALHCSTNAVYLSLPNDTVSKHNQIRNALKPMAGNTLVYDVRASGGKESKGQWRS